MIKIDNRPDKPLVSIVMPAYNSEKYIGDAIQSVLDQTLGSWELIIIDDSSEDATADTAETYAKADDRIRLYQNAHNQGAAETRNTGMRLCAGTYVALLDSDDLWLPDKLARQVGLMETSGADIAYCSYSIIDEAGNKRCNDFIVPEYVDLELALVKSVISCSTAMFRREIAQNYIFPTEYYHEDLALWLTLLKDGKTAAGISDVLACYRIQDSTRASNKLRSAWNRWVIYRRHLKMSLVKSAALVVRYALLGLKKYRRIPPCNG